MNNRNLVIALGAIVLIGGVVFFASLSKKPTSVTPSTQNPNTPTVGAKEVSPTTPVESTSPTKSMEKKAVKEFTVESNGLSFTPSEIRVSQGDTVRVTYKNDKGTHDFTLDEFTVKTKRIGAGATDTVEFVASKNGSFEFYCSVPGHREAGMKGTLVVE